MATRNLQLTTKIQPQKASRIFSQAIDSYNAGHRYHALSTARYALQVARKYAPGLKSDICGFIAFIKLEFGQAALASYYCHQALVYLDRTTMTYGADRHYLLTLQSQIDRLN